MIFHPIWSYYLVWKCELGIVGTGITGVITNLSILIMNIAYSSYLPDTKAGSFLPDKRTFQGLGEYLKLGIPATMMMVIDCWGGSIVCFAAGYISTEALAAMNILTNIMCVIYMVG